MTVSMLQESFPDIPLTESQSETVYNLCGGDDPEITKLQGFLGIYGIAALPDSWFRGYIQTLGARWLETLGVDITQPVAMQNLNRGILFYSGTLRALDILPELPHAGSVLKEINALNPLDGSLDARETVKGLEGFYELFDRYSGALEPVDTYPGFEIALVGAGLAHVIGAESKRILAASLQAESQPMSEEERERGIIMDMEIKFDQKPEPENDRVLPPLPTRGSLDDRQPLNLPPVKSTDRRRIHLDTDKTDTI